MSNRAIIEKELTQGVVPIGTPKAYQYDQALVESAKAEVRQGLTEANTILTAIRNEYGYPFTASSADAMTDHSKIYVYTGTTTSSLTQGHWYYYNGSVWTDGGSYNSYALETDPTLSISGAAADAKVTGDAVSDLNQALTEIALYEDSPNLFDKSEVLTNKNLQVGTGHTINDIEDYTGTNVSPIIEAEASTNYVANSALFGDGTARIYCYNSNGTYLGGVDAIATDGKYFYTTLASTKYMRFVYTPLILNADTYMLVMGTVLPSEYIGFDDRILVSGGLKELEDKHDEDVSELHEEIENMSIRNVLIAIPDVIDHDNILLGGYINGGVDGTVVTDPSITNLWYSDYCSVIGGLSYYYGFIDGIYCAFYDEDKQYISGYGNVAGVRLPNPFTVPENAKYFRFTCVSSSSSKKDNAWINIINEAPEYTSYKYGFVDETIFKINVTNPCDYTGKEISIFNKIICVGDSITDGVFNHNDSGSMEYLVDRRYSYPTYLTKICGVETVNLGVGGYSSVQWWNAHSTDDFSGYDCAIINLGINDALQSVSEADTESALTNIINALRTANNGIKIFMATVIAAYSDDTNLYDDVNDIIKNVATENNCYIIDLSQYSHARKNTVSEAGHLTAWGYRTLAQDYISAISYIMASNRNDFKFIQFVGTDYTYNP